MTELRFSQGAPAAEWTAKKENGSQRMPVEKTFQEGGDDVRGQCQAEGVLALCALRLRVPDEAIRGGEGTSPPGNGELLRMIRWWLAWCPKNSKLMRGAGSD